MVTMHLVGLYVLYQTHQLFRMARYLYTKAICSHRLSNLLFVRRIWAHKISFFVPRPRNVAQSPRINVKEATGDRKEAHSVPPQADSESLPESFPRLGRPGTSESSISAAVSSIDCIGVPTPAMNRSTGSSPPTRKPSFTFSNTEAPSPNAGHHQALQLSEKPPPADPVGQEPLIITDEPPAHPSTASDVGSGNSAQLSGLATSSGQQTCADCGNSQKPLSFCGPCNLIYCDECWVRPLWHRGTAKSNSPAHEKMALEVAEMAEIVGKTLAQPNNEAAQEERHRADETTSWFGESVPPPPFGSMPWAFS